MGVNIGALDMALMRNVPPRTARELPEEKLKERRRMLDNEGGLPRAVREELDAAGVVEDAVDPPENAADGEYRRAVRPGDGRADDCRIAHVDERAGRDEPLDLARLLDADCTAACVTDPGRFGCPCDENADCNSDSHGYADRDRHAYSNSDSYAYTNTD